MVPESSPAVTAAQRHSAIGRVTQLAYLGFEVEDVVAWETFAISILGMEVVERGPTTGIALRMDQHAHRILVSPGRADDLSFMGWEVASHKNLDAIVAHLREHGNVVHEGDTALAAARGVERIFCLEDPAGNSLELVTGAGREKTPFQSKKIRGGYVADQLGLGHLVITNEDNEEHRRFYCDLLGFRLSDTIVAQIGSFAIDLVFLHVNGRHHSLAFGGPQKTRIHHVGLQLASLDDLGKTLDRVRRGGYKVATELGRHPNDHMVSFYVTSPAGFQVEIGWGGREIGPGWRPVQHDQISLWGHWSDV